jgi:hypothetical protein
VASYRLDPIGLVDEGGHSVQDINESGQVLGTSEGTSGDNFWLYSAGVTSTIGWSHPMAQPNSEAHHSNLELNEKGQVIGTIDNEYISGHDGSVAWLHSAGANIRLGLSGSDSADSEQSSSAEGLNEGGRSQEPLGWETGNYRGCISMVSTELSI